MFSLSLWTTIGSCAVVSVVSLLVYLKKAYPINREYAVRVGRRRRCEKVKREKLAHHLADDPSLTEDRRAQILELALPQLAEALRHGKLTAVQVLRTYQAKALEVTERYNCITEFIPDAEERALALDKLPEACRGPLHGVPISVKDNVNVAGMDSTLGLAKHLGKPADDTAIIVKTLMQLGAVPFCKTNIPQSLLSICCSNPVWGETPNIYDSRRVCGGSSGGEAVIVAAGASPLGVGTDIGGSIRLPALFCGCHGIKPTKGRFSDVGVRSCMPQSYTIRGTSGFLARDVASLRLATQLVLSPTASADMYKLDPLVPRIFWDDKMASRTGKLRIGYLSELSLFPVTPGVRRVITDTVQALEEAGHQLVPFQIPCTVKDGEMMAKILQPENGVLMLRDVAGEEIDIGISTFVTLLRMPLWLRRLVAWGTEGRFRYVPMRLRAYTHNPMEAMETQWRWKAMISDVVRRWKHDNLDVLLCPGFMSPAPPAHSSSNLVIGGYYTLLFNVLNFPAGIIPTGFETKEDQAALKIYPTPQVELQWFKEATEGALGQPLGVQVVALPWQEELLLTAMQTVQDVVDKHLH